MATSEWYWCLDHEAAEPFDSSCPPGRRLGPYPTKEAAQNWKEGVAKHNEEWDAEDEDEWKEG